MKKDNSKREVAFLVLGALVTLLVIVGIATGAVLAQEYSECKTKAHNFCINYGFDEVNMPSLVCYKEITWSENGHLYKRISTMQINDGDI